MADAKDHKKWLLTILLGAACVRLVVVFGVFGDYIPADDAWEWSQAARNFIDGKGLIVSDSLKAYRTPVPGLYFAAMYSVFGISSRPIQIANVFLGVLTVWLIYDLVNRTYGRAAALWAATFVCLYPLFLFYTGQMLSETLVLVLLALGLWIAWIARDRAAIWWSLPGTIFGMATLTRETVLPIAVMISIWSFIVRRSEKSLRRCLPGFIMLLFLMLAIAPWAVRNYDLLGRFVPLTSQGGLSLWIANNPRADGTAIGSTFSRVPQQDALPEVERGLAYRNLAIEFIADHPGRFLRLTIIRLSYFWHLGYHGQGFPEILFLALYLPMLALAVTGAWRGWSSNRDATVLFLVIPFSLSLTHMVFLPEGRYRLPAELVMCVFAAKGAEWCVAKMMTARTYTLLSTRADS